MAFPPPTLPVDRTDNTPQLNTHPADHNDANQAINDIVGRLKMVASGYFTTGYGAGIARAAGTYACPYPLGVDDELPTSKYPTQPIVVANLVSGGYATVSLIGTCTLNGDRWEQLMGEVVTTAATVYGVTWMAFIRE